MTVAKTRKPTLPEHLVNSITEAIVTTFESTCGDGLTHKRAETEDELHGEKLSDGVVGIISLVGDLNWLIMTGFPRKTAEALALKFVGFEITFESDDMGDAIGEFANIMAGDACARLEMQDVKVDMSLPAVARGSQIELLQQYKLPSALVQFESPMGSFWTKIVAAFEMPGRKSLT